VLGCERRSVSASIIGRFCFTSFPEFGETHSSVLGCERRSVSASIIGRFCFTSFPEFGETHVSVLGCEMRPVSASIMGRFYFSSFPVCVYKCSSHYLNNIIFYRQHFGASSDRITLYNRPIVAAVNANSTQLILRLVVAGNVSVVYQLDDKNNQSYVTSCLLTTDILIFANLTFTIKMCPALL
jgi:hypothetical protein